MNTAEVENMCYIKNAESFGSSPLPQDGGWDQVKDITQISGLSHGVGGCAPRQGACKLTINVKNGIIKEALVECIGCSGMTHSAAMAGEILVGKTLLEALNTDLVCDAINDAMKNVFFQLVYGRSQSAFSLDGLPIGTCLEDLGKDRASKVASIYASEEKGVRYLNTAEGYITKLALDKNKEIIGFEYVNIYAFMRLIKKGEDGNESLKKCTKQYGRFSEGESFIDPRNE